jgi:hypothetical protein
MEPILDCGNFLKVILEISFEKINILLFLLLGCKFDYLWIKLFQIKINMEEEKNW